MGDSLEMISKIAGKQAGSSMNLLLLVGLLLCGGVAADQCLVKIDHGDTSFKGSLSKKVGEETKHLFDIPAEGKHEGKPDALVLANWYKDSIKAQMTKILAACPDGYQKLVIRQTGEAAIDVKAISDAMIKVHTKVREGTIDVDFKYVNKHGWTPSGAAFAIKNGKVIANDCLVKIEQGDTSFTGSLHTSFAEPIEAETMTSEALLKHKHPVDLADTNAEALSEAYKEGIQGMLGDMKENKHGCISSHWEIIQTGSMQGNDDWAAAMSKAILDENTRVKCSNNDNGTPFSNCIPVDFKAGASRFTINRGKVEVAAGPKAADKKDAKARRLL